MLNLMSAVMTKKIDSRGIGGKQGVQRLVFFTFRLLKQCQRAIKESKKAEGVQESEEAPSCYASITGKWIKDDHVSKEFMISPIAGASEINSVDRYFNNIVIIVNKHTRNQESQQNFFTSVLVLEWKINYPCVSEWKGTFRFCLRCIVYNGSISTVY